MLLAIPARHKSFEGAWNAASSDAEPQRVVTLRLDEAEADMTEETGSPAGAAEDAVEAVATDATAGMAAAKGSSPPAPRGAAQLWVSPPSLPTQFHAHGPFPVTREGLPRAQRSSATGIVGVATPFAAPHVPLTLTSAVQETEAPPPSPSHVHSHGPLPLTDEAVPTLHKSDFGASLWPVNDATPQMASRFTAARQVAAVPPFNPEQVQFHGPSPVTALA